MPSDHLDPALAGWMTDLAHQEHDHQVLTELGIRARETGRDLLDHAVGRLLEVLARAGGAQRVVDLGTGLGAAAHWLARGVGEHGRVHTAGAPDDVAVAEQALRRMELWERVEATATDDPVAVLADHAEGSLDLVHVGLPPAPAAHEAAVPRLRVGGLLVAQHALTDEGRALARHAAEDFRVAVSVLPIATGVLLAVRVE
ncbi:MAG: O-methyltransferase [Actinomycetes bacterium]